jgi:hypothetical protein
LSGICSMMDTMIATGASSRVSSLVMPDR